MSSHTPRHILITGGAGFIGANFIRYLLSHEPEIKIINLDLLTYAGSLQNLTNLPDPSRHTFIQGDICDAPLVKKILEDHEIDTIVHFAAESHVDRSIEGPAPFIHTNILGTFTLLEASRVYWHGRSHCRFHHISTDEVFGSLEIDAPSFTESSRYTPNSPYSASKAGSDHLVRAYFHTFGLPITISHCSNNYGPYQHTEKFIPTVIRACRNRNPIPIYGDGSNIRDWLYVEDHCEAILAILKNGRLGETYNIGGKNECDNLTLAHQICDIMQNHSPYEKSYRSLIQNVPDRLGHDWRYAIDISRISKELGWYPKESFSTGLLKTLQYYK